MILLLLTAVGHLIEAALKLIFILEYITIMYYFFYLPLVVFLISVTNISNQLVTIILLESGSLHAGFHSNAFCAPYM